MKAKATYLLVTIALASCGVAYAALAGHGDGRTRLGAHANANGASALHVSGYVHRLYPGAHARMRIKVANRSGHWVVVHAVRATARDAGPGCSRNNLEAVRKRLHHPRIRPHKTRFMGMRLRMRKGAPDSCQGATFPLRFQVRAGR
ncbi:MAG: hypothetical protein ACRDMH_11460 [Solirubrobacterales bacterium]